MLGELPVREWNGGLVHEARPHVLHLMRGEVYGIDGLTVLAMGGAASNRLDPYSALPCTSPVT